MAGLRPDSGHLGNTPTKPTFEVMVIGDRAYKIHKVIVHEFLMGDVDDPDLYAAQPMIDWEKSEMGKWIMGKAIEVPEWHRYLDHITYGYKYSIVAKLKDVDYTFWSLKWGLDRRTKR